MFRGVEGRHTDVVTEVPAFLDGVGRIILVSDSRRKLGAVKDTLDRFNLVRGSDLVQVMPGSTDTQEPAWSSAVRVAQHKVYEYVGLMEGSAGPKTVVLGSDVVVSINGIHYLNLSRNGKMTGTELNQEAARLAEIFSNQTTVIWDVALAGSRPGLFGGTPTRLTTATRVCVHFDPICRDSMKRLFWDDIHGAMGRNTRVPLIDSELTYQAIASIGMLHFVQARIDQSGYIEDWHRLHKDYKKGDAGFSEMLDVARRMIVGGLPHPDNVKKLFNVIPGGGNGEWRLV